MVSLLLALCLALEHLQFLGFVHGLPVIVEDRRGIQWLGVHLVAITAQSNDDGVQVEYNLDILHLPNVPIRSSDGEGDEVIAIVVFESWWGLVAMRDVTSLVQGEAFRGGCVWGFVLVVRVSQVSYEWVLSWVEVLAHVAVGAAPWAPRCWCTDWCSASLTAIIMFLLAMALANCLSLHSKHTLLMAFHVAIWVVKGDWKRDLARTTIFRSPNVSIDLVDFSLVGWGGSHPIRV